MAFNAKDEVALALELAESEGMRIGAAVDAALRMRPELLDYARAWDAWAAACGNPEAGDAAA